MYSLQYRPHMDHTPYPEIEGAAAEGRRLLIFCIFIMIHLWHVLKAAHGLCTAYEWPIYGLCMTYWSIYNLHSRIFKYVKFSISTSTPMF